MACTSKIYIFDAKKLVWVLKNPTIAELIAQPSQLSSCYDLDISGKKAIGILDLLGGGSIQRINFIELLDSKLNYFGTIEKDLFTAAMEECVSVTDQQRKRKVAVSDSVISNSRPVTECLDVNFWLDLENSTAGEIASQLGKTIVTYKLPEDLFKSGKLWETFYVPANSYIKPAAKYVTHTRGCCLDDILNIVDTENCIPILYYGEHFFLHEGWDVHYVTEAEVQSCIKSAISNFFETIGK